MCHLLSQQKRTVQGVPGRGLNTKNVPFSRLPTMKNFHILFIETPSQFSLQSMWKVVVAQMCHLKAAHQKWDRTDVSSVKLSEACSVM